MNNSWWRVPAGRIRLLCMATTSQVQKNLRNAMREALRIQDRLVAEPHFAKTGRGYLKSEGVATLQKIKASRRPAQISFPFSRHF
jgi:hypothetical protein